jgi:phosphoesterase RecJ-like protein
MQELFVEAGNLLKKAQKVLCISHKKPDGDTLGASNAFYHVLRDMGKQVDFACIDEIPEKFHFLSGVTKSIKSFNYQDYDLLIVSDAGASYMTKYQEIYPDIFSGRVPVINFDHHASNDNFGTLNIVDVRSASTTVLIYKLLTFLGVKITPPCATALLSGIYNDTGSLMHQNTTLEVFEIAGKLVELGAKVNLVAKNLFRTTPVNTMKAWGKVLERATLNEEGVVISVITEKDFKDIGARSDDLSGVVDFMNAVPGSKFTVLINEDEKGNVKGSFRTRRDDIDLAKLAESFGGGGHKKAAGFTMKGRIHQEVRWKVKPNGGTENLNNADQKKPVLNNPEQLLGNILQIPEVKIG